MPTDMLQMASKFPEQIKEAYELGRNVRVPKKSFKNIIVAGMGGSGIGGDLLASWLNPRSSIPAWVNRDYTLPAFAGPETLLFAVSYSGNTEETLSAFRDGVRRGCTIIGITSGGKLGRECTTSIRIPRDMQPRTAIAYLLFPMIGVLDGLGVVEADEEVQESIAINGRSRDRLNEDAKRIARELTGIPVIYGHTIYAPIAKRIRCQFNENAKILARDDNFPEMCHNDIMGWPNAGWTVILLRSADEAPYLARRIEVTKELAFGDVKVIELWAKGNSPLARMTYLLYLGDLISIHLALQKGADPTSTEIIGELKRRLA